MSEQKTEIIAFLGIGLMGEPMARNLLKAGYKLNAWNRTRSKAEKLTSDGANVFDLASDAVSGADIIITMLENGPIVENVLFELGVAANVKKAATIIDMSSIPPKTAQSHSEKLIKMGINHIDAPVSGGTRGAAEASLAIMAGGQEEVFQSVLAIFQTLGRATYIGPSGTGQLSKCANQVIVGNTIAAVAEGLLLAAAGGANPAAVREALMGGFADSRILQEHGKRMLDDNFTPGGMVKTQLKDLNTALEAIEGIDLPTTQTVQSLYQNLDQAGHGELDHSAVLLELENRNNGYKLIDS